MTRLAKDDKFKVFDGTVQDESKLLTECGGDGLCKDLVVTTGPAAVVIYESQSETPGGGINFGYMEG